MDELKILVLACSWCAHRGNDITSDLGLDFPTQARLVQTMCAGRVDLETVLESLSQGSDGMIVLACQQGDCNYNSGSCMAQKQVSQIRQSLAKLDIETERLCLIRAATGEVDLFRQELRAMFESLKSLGPLDSQKLPDK